MNTFCRFTCDSTVPTEAAVCIQRRFRGCRDRKHTGTLKIIQAFASIVQAAVADAMSPLDGAGEPFEFKKESFEAAGATGAGYEY